MFSLTFHNSSSESISSHKATDEKAVVAAGTKDEVDGVELEEVEVEVDANTAVLEKLSFPLCAVLSVIVKCTFPPWYLRHCDGPMIQRSFHGQIHFCVIFEEILLRTDFCRPTEGSDDRATPVLAIRDINKFTRKISLHTRMQRCDLCIPALFKDNIRLKYDFHFVIWLQKILIIFFNYTHFSRNIIDTGRSKFALTAYSHWCLCKIQ